MAIQDIVKRIIGDAQKKANDIGANAARQGDEILKDAKARIKRIIDEYVERGRAEADRARKQLLSQARVKARKASLGAKGEAIDEAFVRAIDDLAALDDDRYKGLIRGMLLGLDLEGDCEVMVSSRDRNRITRAFLAEIQDEFNRKGAGVSLNPSTQDADISGGFIIKTKRSVYDNSFHSIINARRDEIEPEVAKILFGGV